ncbi:MAG: hypothetical protein WAT12_12885 [Candidatus Nitrotoga sp.]
MNKKISLFAVLVMTVSAAYAEDASTYKEESRAVVMPFLKQLATENQKAISEGGPESAIIVCKDIAPNMAGDISR